MFEKVREMYKVETVALLMIYEFHRNGLTVVLQMMVCHSLGPVQ